MSQVCVFVCCDKFGEYEARAKFENNKFIVLRGSRVCEGISNRQWLRKYQARIDDNLVLTDDIAFDNVEFATKFVCDDVQISVWHTDTGVSLPEALANAQKKGHETITDADLPRAKQASKVDNKKTEVSDLNSNIMEILDGLDDDGNFDDDGWDDCFAEPTTLVINLADWHAKQNMSYTRPTKLTIGELECTEISSWAETAEATYYYLYINYQSTLMPIVIDWATRHKSPHWFFLENDENIGNNKVREIGDSGYYLNVNQDSSDMITIIQWGLKQCKIPLKTVFITYEKRQVKPRTRKSNINTEPRPVVSRTKGRRDMSGASSTDDESRRVEQIYDIAPKLEDANQLSNDYQALEVATDYEAIRTQFCDLIRKKENNQIFDTDAKLLVQASGNAILKTSKLRSILVSAGKNPNSISGIMNVSGQFVQVENGYFVATQYASEYLKVEPEETKRRKRKETIEVEVSDSTEYDKNVDYDELYEAFKDALIKKTLGQLRLSDSDILVELSQGKALKTSEISNLFERVGKHRMTGNSVLNQSGRFVQVERGYWVAKKYLTNATMADCPEVEVAKPQPRFAEVDVTRENARIQQVLRDRFGADGMIPGAMGKMKFEVAYQTAFGESCDFDYVKSSLPKLAFRIEETYYQFDCVLRDDKREALLTLIDKWVQIGAPRIDYGALLEQLDLQPIQTPEVLRNYLERVVQTTYACHADYLVIQQDEFDLLEAIEGVFQTTDRLIGAGFVERDTIRRALPYIASKNLDAALKTPKRFVTDGTAFMPADYLQFEDNEVEVFRSVIERLLPDGMVTYDDFCELLQRQNSSLFDALNDMLEGVDRNSILRSVLAHYFDDQYAFSDHGIAQAGKQATIQDVVEREIGHYGKVTLEQIEELIRTFGLSNSQVEVYRYVYEHFVRLNAENFVCLEESHFDVEKIDQVINELMDDQYLPVRDIDLNRMPVMWTTWNEYLLVSYLYSVSENFELLGVSTVTKNGLGGVVIKKKSKIKYESVLIDYLMRHEMLLESPQAAERGLKEAGLIIKWSDRTRSLYDIAVKQAKG